MRKGIAWLFAGILGISAMVGIEYGVQGKTSNESGWCRCAPTGSPDGCIMKTDSIMC